ncbi:hypothetical protein, partial [Embleya hyalina]|uniref:hypothetical protein n=1 Tax=Embleya hyalina TaxID=516124 RepID=UPI001C3F9885
CTDAASAHDTRIPAFPQGPVLTIKRNLHSPKPTPETHPAHRSPADGNSTAGSETPAGTVNAAANRTRSPERSR